MYEFFTDEKIDKKYPILKTNEQAIAIFVSTDAVWGYGVPALIRIKYPKVYQTYKHYALDNKDNKIQKGMILSLKVKEYNKYILCCSVKEDFLEKVDFDSLKECITKIKTKAEELNIKTIAIQKCFNINQQIIERAIEELNIEEFPEIIYYDEPEDITFSKKKLTENKDEITE